MLFLLNDRIFDLDLRRFESPLDPTRFKALSLPFVMKLGQEAFADVPLLHRDEPERARRLAMLIAIKAPEVNAALFVSPAKNCRPDEVTGRFATLGLELIASLYRRDKEGGLDLLTADREVWRRMAA